MSRQGLDAYTVTMLSRMLVHEIEHARSPKVILSYVLHHLQRRLGTSEALVVASGPDPRELLEHLVAETVVVVERAIDEADGDTTVVDEVLDWLTGPLNQMKRRPPRR